MHNATHSSFWYPTLCLPHKAFGQNVPNFVVPSRAMITTELNRLLPPIDVNVSPDITKYLTTTSLSPVKTIYNTEAGRLYAELLSLMDDI